MTKGTDGDLAALDQALAGFDRAPRRIGVSTRPVPDIVAIIEREKELGLEMPAVVKAFYSHFDGVDVDAMAASAEGIRIWPLEDLRHSGPDEAGAFGSCVVFADFLLSSIEYGVALESGSIVLLNGTASQLVAKDLPRFLAKCVVDDRSIYGIRSP